MKLYFILGIIIMTFVALAFILTPLIKQKKLKIIIFISIIFPLISILGYIYWGNASGLWHYWQYQEQAARAKIALSKIKNPQAVVNQLQAYLYEHPNNPQGWYLLGKIYLHHQVYHQAVEALGKAYHQAMNNVDYKTTYAEALFFDHHRQLNTIAKDLLKQVLEETPNNIAANNLLAIDAYNQGHYQQAIFYWEKLIPLFDAQSKDEQLLLKMIAKAQKKHEQF